MGPHWAAFTQGKVCRMLIIQKSLKYSGYSGKFYLVVPQTCLFIAFITSRAGIAYCMHIILTTCRSCKSSLQKPALNWRPRVQLQIEHPPPPALFAWISQALITLYPLFPLFPFECRSQTSSGLDQGCIRKEAVVCRILDLDLIYCRCERMRGMAGGEGKIWQEGRKDFIYRDWILPQSCSRILNKSFDDVSLSPCVLASLSVRSLGWGLVGKNCFCEACRCGNHC